MSSLSELGLQLGRQSVRVDLACSVCHAWPTAWTFGIGKSIEESSVLLVQTYSAQDTCSHFAAVPVGHCLFSQLGLIGLGQLILLGHGLPPTSTSSSSMISMVSLDRPM